MLKILRIIDPDNTEKIAEFVDGELRGMPRFAEAHADLQGATEEEVKRTFSGFKHHAVPMEEDEVSENFPDPEWEPDTDGSAE